MTDTAEGLITLARKTHTGEITFSEFAHRLKQAFKELEEKSND